MARYYEVQIGDIWLTTTGAEGGTPCKVVIDPAGGLLQPSLGNVASGSDGTPYRETPLTPTGAGRRFTITAAWMTKTVFDELRTDLDAAAAANSEFGVTGSGVPGDFDVNAVVDDTQRPYLDHGGFTGTDRVKDVVISLITTSIN